MKDADEKMDGGDKRGRGTASMPFPDAPSFRHLYVLAAPWVLWDFIA
jgi:hypothetical protein